jgi:hypothetical protein
LSTLEVMMRRRPGRFVVVVRRLLTASLAAGGVGIGLGWSGAAATPPARFSPDQAQIAALASSLLDSLRNRSFRAPDGSEVVLVARSGDGATAPQALLDEERARASLATVTEAEGWPQTWLVLADSARSYDVVMILRVDERGSLIPPETVFAAERRDWDAAALTRAAKEATGLSPRGGGRLGVVIQSFKRRVVTTYVYEPPKSVGGLLALLPPGSILREAASVDLGDGRRHTVALVLSDARLVPADCSTCAGRLFGHADTGKIQVVLAGESAIEDRQDLTGFLKGANGQPLLPRFACTPADAASRPVDESYEQRFGGREPVRLLVLRDLDGDGNALELDLPGELLDCTKHTVIVVGIDRRTGKLRGVEERLVRAAPAITPPS